MYEILEPCELISLANKLEQLSQALASIVIILTQ